MKKTIAMKDFTDIETNQDVSKDISNNLGEILQEAKANTKVGSKLENLKTQIKELKEIIKDIDASSLHKNREAFEKFVDIAYEDSSDQKSWMMRQTDPLQLQKTAWNILLSKMDRVDSLQTEIDELLT